MGLGTWDAKRSKWKTAVGTPARSARVAAQTALLQTMRQSTEYTPAQINAEAAILAGLTAKAEESFRFFLSLALSARTFVRALV